MTSIGTSPTPRVRNVEFRPENSLNPSNLDEIEEEWDTALRLLYGKAGGFIKSGYLTKAMPEPDIELYSTDPDVTKGIMWKLKLKNLETEMSEVVKVNARYIEQRPTMFAWMYDHLSKSARDHLARDKSADKIISAGDDPVALWKLMRSTLVSHTLGNSVAAQGAALQSYNALKQGGMDLCEFHRMFKAKHNAMTAAGLAPTEEPLMAFQYLFRLDPARFGEINIMIENGMITRPDTVQKAYELAAGWKTLRVKPAGTALATVEKKKEKPKQHEPREPRKKRDGHNIPYKVMSEYRDKAIAAGFKMGSCFICGKDNHAAYQCPDYKERKEDSYAAVEEDEDDEGYEFGFATVRKEVQKSNTQYFAGKGELHSKNIGMDSLSTTHIMCNASLLKNVRACKPKQFTGIGGTESVSQVGDHDVWGKVYVRNSDDSINLLSLACIESSPGFTIEYYQKLSKFVVTDPRGGKHEFCRGTGKLYVCEVDDDGATEGNVCLYNELVDNDMSVEPSDAHLVAMETVAKNKALFTVEQVEAAERVRAFGAAMGHMSEANLHALVRSGRVASIDFGHRDIERAHKIFGTGVETIRGKSMRKNTKFADPVVGKVVESELVAHIDIMFVRELPFLTTVMKPLNLLLCTLVKSKGTADVKRAVDGHIATVTNEGFNVTDITSDGEGAIGSMQGELEKAGCKVSIHGKSTNSSDVDNKIRQLKWTMRSVLVLPFYFPIILTAALVAFCVAKINMTPSRANAHWYSPYEIVLGRPISVDRDLGGKGGNGPLSFCSRVEIFDRTSNTMAERTSPALFLGSKGNNYGTALFFKLDTETIVSSDQWKKLPMDAGTIARVNAIAKKRPLFPKKIPMYYGGKEVLDLPVQEEVEVSLHESPYVGRVVADSGRGAPTGATINSYEPEGELEMVNADTAIEVDELSQLMEERGDSGESSRVEDPVVNDRRVRFHHTSGGAADTSGGNDGANEARSGEDGGAIRPTAGTMIDESSRYHHPVYDDSSRSNPVGAAWFLDGAPVEPTEGRPQRVRKVPDRLTYQSFAVSESLVRDVIAVMEPSSRRPVGNRMPYRPSVNRSASEHESSDNRSERHHSSFIVAVDKAINQFGGKALDSLHKELSGLHQKKVFSQVLLKDLSESQKKSIIHSKMFLKEKFFPDGTFDKLKSRLVAGGHMQLRSDYSENETSSPTVGLSSVYLVLSLAAREKRKVGTADRRRYSYPGIAPHYYCYHIQL
jgi:hypothetical protein